MTSVEIGQTIWHWYHVEEAPGYAIRSAIVTRRFYYDDDNRYRLCDIETEDDCWLNVEQIGASYEEVLSKWETNVKRALTEVAAKIETTTLLLRLDKEELQRLQDQNVAIRVLKGAQDEV